MTNYYHILGITENASADEIKIAFKKKAVRYHPDKHGSDPSMEEKFKEINHAYQVLSDPYEKARYDLKLKYRQFSDTTTSRQPHTYRRRAYPRPVYAPPRIDYRQNTIATLYAFGITLGIAVIVMIGVWIKEGYDEKKYQELLSERREVYMEAKASYDNEEYEKAFELMSNFRFFRMEERDMKLFKDHMVDDVIDKGSDSFENKEYDHAIYLFELVQQFEPKKPLFTLKTQLAEAYKKVDEPEKSIEIYEDLMGREYRIIAALVEIAKIQSDMIGDMEASWEYYTRAHKRAVKQYKNFYGEGYSLVIDQKYVPAEHYDLYTGLADIYLKLENPEMAIKASNWNKYVWPDSVDAYIISAKAYIDRDELEKACAEYLKARTLGWKGKESVICN